MDVEVLKEMNEVSNKLLQHISECAWCQYQGVFKCETMVKILTDSHKHFAEKAPETVAELMTLMKEK